MYIRNRHYIVNPLCESEVTQSCPILCDPMNYAVYSSWNSPGQNTEWVALSFSRGRSPGDLPHQGSELGSPALQADS